MVYISKIGLRHIAFIVAIIPFLMNNPEILMATSLSGLTVIITPHEADQAGAKWRIDKGEWHNSGETVNVPVGNHVIEYKKLSGWKEPDNEQIQIIENTDKTIGRIYKRQPSAGSLAVRIRPDAAIRAGAKWRVDREEWSSGDTIRGLSVGSHTVEYKAIDGWHTPKKQPVRIEADTDRRTEGIYKPQNQPRTTSPEREQVSSKQSEIEKLRKKIEDNYNKFLKLHKREEYDPSVKNDIITVLSRIISDSKKLEAINPTDRFATEAFRKNMQITLDDRIKGKGK